MIDIFSAQGGHGVIDHADLRAVSVGNDDFTAFLDEVDDGFGRRFDGLHLFREGVSQGVASESDDDALLFLSHNDSPSMTRGAGPEDRPLSRLQVYFSLRTVPFSSKAFKVAAGFWHLAT